MSGALRAATLVELLDAVGHVVDDGLRFVDRHERERLYPWGVVARRARFAATRLAALGVERGDRVALVLPTGPEFFDGLFGAQRLGAIPVPLYPPVRLGRLDEEQRRTTALLRAVGARLVLTDRRIARVIGAAIDEAGAACAIVPFAGIDDADDDASPPAAPRPAADDPALIQFSSGTTVDPKPVVLSHRAMLAQTHALNSFWPDSGQRRHAGVSWLPLYHDMGLIGCVLPALERPTTLTLLPPEAFVARPALWLRAIARHRATVSPAPNFAYALCAERIRDDELEGVDLSCWRVALNGAEPVTPGTIRAFAARFAPYGFDPRAMTPVYGMAEAALAVTFSDLGAVPRVERFDLDAADGGGDARTAVDGRALVSVGVPLPGFDLRVVDEAGRPLAERRVGRIHVAGPSLMDGYWNRPEATREVLREGWLDTGDLGLVHDGELFLTGRAKEMLLVRGRNHDPGELERAVDGVANVRTGCVVAVGWLPEHADRESIALLVETRRGIPVADRDGIARACEETVLRRVGVVLDRVLVLAPGTLPRTSSGKLRRGEALRRMRTGTLRPPGSPGLGVARAWIRSTLRRPERRS